MKALQIYLRVQISGCFLSFYETGTVFYSAISNLDSSHVLHRLGVLTYGCVTIGLENRTLIEG